MSSQALPRSTKISNFEIQRVLGEGAFGITYLVTNALGQKRSIKEFFPDGYAQRNVDGRVVPHSGLGDKYKLALQRFSDEAKIVSQLDHPHIVKGLDFFEANDTAYFVMPFYEGASLDHYIVGGDALDPDEARHILGRLSGALAHIHAKGIVHRDIKPANIFIVEESGEPILLDFGAARLSDAVSDAAGSDHYRAPEQTGRVDTPVTPATDMYGLSATLYRLISGSLPVDARQRLEAVKAGQADPLKPLSSAAALVSDFGDTFLQQIDSGLSLEPGARPSQIDAGLAKTATAPTPEAYAPPDASTAPAAWSAPPAPGYGYVIEPEARPVMRYAFLGFVLVAILGGGGYLAINNLEFARNDPAAPTTPAADEGETPAQGAEVTPAPEETPKPETRLTPAQAWVKALGLDTLDGYREYLRNFPTSANADKARAEIRRFDDAAFAEAEQRDTLAAYQSYIEAFPAGAHVDEAQAAIKAIQNARAARQRAAAAEQAAWTKAAAANTAQAYQDFLERFPSGANAAKARARLDTLNASAADTQAFNAAKNINSKTAYQTYIQSYPQGQHVPAAMKAIDDLTSRPGGVIKDCDACPPVKILPSGGFQQGAGPDDALARSTEKPERRVDFTKMFAMGVTEVTFTQWNACVSAGGCQAVPDQGWGGGSRPVINVTWTQARGYTDWLSQKTGERYNLPSESQWEYGARAGEIRPFLGGSTQGVCVFANGAGRETGANWANPDCQDPAGDRTMPAGSLAANKFGLKDVLGNVAEWTLDCGSLNYRDSPADGSPNMRGSCRQRITRGGSWFAGPRDMRLSSRAPMRQSDKNEFTGFRVVRAVKN